MAPPESAPFPTSLQLCADAFRIFNTRNMEQHPPSAVHVLLPEDERIAASCGGELIFGELRADPVTNSAMVHHRDRETASRVL